MADPLSIAASVAGLVSFGLEVCRGLTDYYEAWKGYEADVTALQNAIDNLVHILVHFEDRLRSPIHLKPDAVKTVLSHVAACREGLNTLQAKLDKVRARSGSGRMDKLDRFARRATYPFKASTLAKLQEIVGELRQNLMAALGVLQLDHALLTAQKLDEISSGIAVLQDTTTKSFLSAAIKAWLKAPDPSTNYNTALGKREATTGEWFVLSGDFTQWLRQPNSVLWLHGGAGCGKTVLCSTIITATKLAAETDGSSAVLYYFFDFNDPEKQQPLKLVISLAQQLAVRDSEAQSALEQLYALYEGLHKPTLDQLLATFHTMIKSSSLNHVYLIMDALDECKDKDMLLDGILRPIVDWGFAQVHILATSRQERDIVHVFAEIATRVLPIQSQVVDADIRIFVANQILRDHWWDKWSESVRQEVIETLVLQAKGMFRWAVCQLQEVRKSINVKMLKRLLKTLPKTLDATYNRALSNIDPEYMDYATRMLPWLCFSFRPMDLVEVNEVFAMRLDSDVAFDEEELLDNPYDMQEVCPSLVTITTEMSMSIALLYNKSRHARPIIRLAHYSVKEFLVSDRLSEALLQFKITEQKAHATLAEICIRCLLRFNGEGPWTQESSNRYPLAQYAAENWFRHLRETVNTPASERLHQLALELLDEESTAFQSMLGIHDLDSAQLYSVERTRDPVSSLYVSCVADLPSVAERLLEQTYKGLRQQLPEGAFGSSLKAAIYGRDPQLTETLLKHGVSISEDRLINRPFKVHRIGPYTIIEPADLYGHSPLVVAAEEEEEPMIELLLTYMQPGPASLKDCGNALDALISRPNRVSQKTIQKIIQFLTRSQKLVKKDPDLSESTGAEELDNRKAPSVGAKESPKPIAVANVTLKRSHARSGAVTEKGKTSAASQSTARRSTMTWIQRDSHDPVEVVHAEEAPEAVLQNNTQPSTMLRSEDGTDEYEVPSPEDPPGHAQDEIPSQQSASYPVRYVVASIRERNATMLKALLAEGADANTRHLGYTILYEACETGSVECVAALLEAGADPRLLNPEGATTLIANSTRQAHVREMADEWLTALHVAAKYASFDPASDFFGNSSSTSPSRRIMQLLIQSGADLDAASRNGRTPASFYLTNIFDRPSLMDTIKGKDLPNTRRAMEIRLGALHVVRRAMRRRHEKIIVTPVSPDRGFTRERLDFAVLATPEIRESFQSVVEEP